MPLRGAPPAASTELRRALLERRLRLRWLALGAAATALVSLIPSLGVLQLLVLAPLQLFCIEKATRDFTTHLPGRAAFGFELASGLLYLLLAAIGVGVGFVAETLSVFVSVPAFVLAFFGTRAMAIGLARRTAEGKGPGALVGGLMGLLAVAVATPPVVLFVVSARLSSDLQARVWDPKLVLQLASMGSISALDLFLMPAWLTSILSFAGMAEVAPAFSWAGTWWFALLATGLVCGEAVVDNAFDRRRRFSRKVWPAIQSMLAAPTMFFMVCVLGRDLDWRGRLLALAAGLAGGWQLRRGVNRVKTAVGFFPGASLASRRAQLLTIPLRLAGALVLVVVAMRRPYFVALAIAAAALGTGALLVFLWVGRRALRADSRMACSGCGTSVKRRATLCWKCHQPVALSLVRSHPPHVRELMSAAAAFVGAPAAERERLELAVVPRQEADALRSAFRKLEGPAARDVLAVASWVSGASNERLGDLARLLARRSVASALLEEL